MVKSEALEILTKMNEDTFQSFFATLPERVKLCCRGELVNWKDVLPDWYIKHLESEASK